MKKSQCSEEQIATALRQIDAGTPGARGDAQAQDQ